MKKYTHYRVGLFIGLLSLQTLSACVHTRQELGFSRKQVQSVFIPAGLLAGLSGIGYGTYYYLRPSNPVNPGMNNDSSVTNGTPFMPVESNTSTMPYINLTTTEATFITNAIEEGPDKWGNGTSYNETSYDDNISTITTPSTTDDVPPVENPMLLDERVMSDLKAHGFSKERIEYWVARGLSVNARNEENGNTLLYEAAYEPNEGTVRELLKIPGIDLSVEGYVDILQWAVANGYSGIATLVLEAELGNVNSKDSDDNNLWHLAAKNGSLHLLEVLKNRLTTLILQEKNKDGKTPVEVAEENGHQAAVDALQNMIHSSER